MERQERVVLFSFECARACLEEKLVKMAWRVHLYPYRTQKLSSIAPKILGGRLPGKIGLCQHKKEADTECICFFFVCLMVR